MKKQFYRKRQRLYYGLSLKIYASNPGGMIRAPGLTLCGFGSMVMC
ncbi:MAG: hypothetical protein VYE04_14445 [Pseudomonadota bacterium]|nr:hypothetical protein [Pseudomonadota bacterium]